MKRYLTSSNSIMNLNDKKSLDFQSISIVQNNNLVFAQYCVFSKYLQFYIIQIKSLYNSNFIRVANMVQCASQCSATEWDGAGRVTLVPWLLNIFSQHGGKNICAKCNQKYFAHTEPHVVFVGWFGWHEKEIKVWWQYWQCECEQSWRVLFRKPF